MIASGPQSVLSELHPLARRSVWESILFAACAACAVAALAYLGARQEPYDSRAALQINVALGFAVLALACLLPARYSRRLTLILAAIVAASTVLTVVPWLFESSGVLEHPFFTASSWSLGPFASRSMVVMVIALAVGAVGVLMLARPAAALSSSFTWAAGLELLLTGAALMTGRLDAPQRLFLFGHSAAGYTLLVCAIVFLGGALLFRRTPADARSAQYEFRYRALFLLLMLSGSTLLWHELRAVEWSNLQTDLSKTLSRDISAASRAGAERASAMQRLSWHWRDLGWSSIPDALMLKDANAMMLSYPGLITLMRFDARGELQKSVARRQAPVALGGGAASLQVVQFMQPAQLTQLGWNDKFAQTVKVAVQTRRMLGTEPQDFASRPRIAFIAQYVSDDEGKSIGVLGAIINLDYATNVIFNNVTAGYGVALSYGSIPYLASENIPKPRVIQRIAPVVASVTVTRLPMRLEIWPSKSTVGQMLTPLPGLALLGGWLASALLLLAWRAESRAHQLVVERQAILDHSPDIIFTLDRQDQFVSVNAASRSILKYSPQELLGRSSNELIPETYRRQSAAELQAARSGRSSIAFETRWIRKDDVIIDVQWSGLWSKAAQLMYCVARDVTERRKTAYLENGQRDILRMIAAGEAQSAILGRIVRMIEDLCPGTRASILEVDRAGALVHCAAPDLPVQYQRELEAAGIQADVAHSPSAGWTVRPTITTDIFEDSRWVACRPTAKAHALRACWTMPLSGANDEPIGALAVYVRDARGPSTAELQTTQLVGSLAAIAMERARHDAQLLISEQRMAEAQRIAYVGSWNYFPDIDRFECSQECLRVLGVQDAKQLRNSDQARALIHPDDLPAIMQALSVMTSLGKPVDVVHRIVRPNGETRHVHSRSSFVATSPEGTMRIFGTLQDVTEHHELEEALRRSEDRYRSIATQVGAIHIEWNLISGKVSYDGAIQQLLGYAREELQHMSFYEVSLLVHPDDIPAMRGIIKFARHHVSDWNAEYRLRHKLGHYVVVNSHGIFLGDSTQRAQRMLMTAADITERKRVESLLRESEERLRIATEQSGRAVYDLDHVRRKVRWAGATEQLFGYTCAEIENVDWDKCLEHVDPQDLHSIRQELAANPANGGTSHREFRVRRKDGSIVHVESISAAQLDTQGRPYRRIGVLSNVTERRRAEREQQRYTIQLRTLAEVARKITTFLTTEQLTAFLADAMREIIGAQQAAISVTGTKPSGILIHRVSVTDGTEVRRSSSIPANYAGISDLLSGPQHALHLTQQELLVHPCWNQVAAGLDAALPMHGLLAARMIAGDGSSLGVLWLSQKADGEFTDGDLQILTQLGGLAAVAIENARLLATLELRVAQRTQDLEISNRELEAFSYSVSHDLRAPLRAIAGFSEILNSQYTLRLDDQGRRCLERITAGVQRMAELIDDLLGLARVSRADITRLHIDLSAIALAVVNRQRERHAGRDISVTIDPAVRAAADPRLLEVVLDNLLENAFKFTGTRPQTQIHFGSREINGERVYFVSDNGVGFDPTYAANLFGVFQRLHSVNEFPGTGVGLAIVQRIIHRHGGRVWAEATVNHGATFFFTLSPALASLQA